MKPKKMTSMPMRVYLLLFLIILSLVFDMLRHINDPEHPLTLEQLNVVSPDLISVDSDQSLVVVKFTPTIPNCTMATLIGLMIRVKLHRSLPSRFKVDVYIEEGKHEQ